MPCWRGGVSDGVGGWGVTCFGVTFHQQYSTCVIRCQRTEVELRVGYDRGRAESKSDAKLSRMKMLSCAVRAWSTSLSSNNSHLNSSNGGCFKRCLSIDSIFALKKCHDSRTCRQTGVSRFL